MLSFSFVGDKIYYCKKGENEAQPLHKRLLLEDPEQVKAALQESHERSGHHGIRGTHNKVMAHYYWLTITEDIREWVS